MICIKLNLYKNNNDYKILTVYLLGEVLQCCLLNLGHILKSYLEASLLKLSSVDIITSMLSTYHNGIVINWSHFT